MGDAVQSQKMPVGRQAAYTARNRAALISSAQTVLADIGPSATIDQLVAQAQVSPTTIYNYFDNKEALFSEALDQVWRDWVEWAYGGVPQGESFRAMLQVCQKLFRVESTHPQFAQILRNTLSNPSFVIDAVKGAGTSDLEAVAVKDGLDTSDFDKRLNLWSYCIAGILHGVFVSGNLSPTGADDSLRISLAIWNVSPDVAASLTSHA